MLGRPGVIREELEVVVIDRDDYDNLMNVIDAAESLACTMIPLLKELNTPFARPDVNYGRQKAEDVMRQCRDIRVAAEDSGYEDGVGYGDYRTDEND